jgi:hypothetical protein
VDFIGNGLHQSPEEVPGNTSVGNVDVEIANRIALELLLRLFVASRPPATEKYRGAEGIDAVTKASDEGWSVGAHRGNHQAAALYACET